MSALGQKRTSSLVSKTDPGVSCDARVFSYWISNGVD
jgi:hypothetical protein